MARYLYSELSSLIQARRNCIVHPFTTAEIKSHCAVCGEINTHSNHSMQYAEWFDKHSEIIEKLVKDHMPHGSGFDSGTTIDLDASHAGKLVFNTSFHHMNDNGFYDGWTEHTVTVTPSFTGIDIRVSGRNRNDIKDYIHEQFDYALSQDVTYDLFLPQFPQYEVTSKWEDKDGTPSQCYQAWYVGEWRFWNNPSAARTFAAAQMEIARNKR